ncbi:MAG: cation diffusion facilitator family transporter [Bacteroides sp.]|nr:cation diffusion facilitator family transporter [Bacteroides sp.]
MDAREKEIYKVTLVGSAVNAILIVLKFLAGFVGRSSALIADAVHSLSDFVTDIIVLVFVRIAGRPKDKSHDYGHGKFETFATMVIGFILILAGIGLMVNGIELIIKSLRGHELPKPTYLALSIALVSIISKELLYHYTMRVGVALNSQAVRANAWHHRSDAISSLGTLIGVAGAMFLGSRWRILDPVAAVVVSLFIIKSGYDIMKPAVEDLLECSLPDPVENKIRESVRSVDGISHVINLRTRRVGNTIAIDLTAKMDGKMTLCEAHEKASEAERRLRHLYGKDTIISIHMEPISNSVCYTSDQK